MTPRFACRAVVLSLVSNLLVSLPSLAASPNDFDIVGLRLGQDVQQARQAIHAYDPKMQLGEVLWTAQPGVPTSTAVIHAGTAADIRARKGYGYLSNDFHDFVQVTFGQVTGKAYYVVHRVGILAENKVTVASMEKALIEKYGPPTEKRPNQLVWRYRADGRVANNTEGCDSGDLIAANHELSMPPRAGCGVSLIATFPSLERNPTTVFIYRLAMLDHAAQIRDIEAIRARNQAAAEKRDRDAVKQNSGNAPKL